MTQKRKNQKNQAQITPSKEPETILAPKQQKPTIIRANLTAYLNLRHFSGAN